MRPLLWLVGVIGGLLIGAGLFLLGYGLYVRYVVGTNPSTQAVVRSEAGGYRLGRYTGGDQVAVGPAEQEASASEAPGADTLTPRPQASDGEESPRATPTSDGEGSVEAATPTAQPTAQQAMGSPTPLSRPILPPTELKIPKLGLDAAIVLADNENLPQFRGVGWLLGSGYPGFRGNVVLFGHLNGQYEAFARLGELISGDEVIVVAHDRSYRYLVKAKRTVPRAAVAVLAPSRDYRLTLITCTGTFYPQTRDYSHRLVVIAEQFE